MTDNRPKIVEVFTRKTNSFWPFIIYSSDNRTGLAISAVCLRGPSLKRIFGCIPEKVKVGILMEEGALNPYAD